MEGAAGILVVILSVFLAIFLILAIVLVVMLIKVTRQIKSVTNSAQRTVEGVEKTVRSFSAVSGPLAVARMVKSMLNISKTKK